MGVAVGSSTVFGVSAAEVTDDWNGDGTDDLKAAAVGCSVIDWLGDNVGLVSVDDGVWQGGLTTPEGGVHLQISSSVLGGKDTFTYMVTNENYDPDGRGIASLTVSLGAQISVEMIELTVLPDGWEMETAIGSLGGFINLVATEETACIGPGESVSVGFSLPSAGGTEAPPGKREMPAPPGFLIGGSVAVQVGVANILREDEPGTPMQEWLQEWLRHGYVPPSRPMSPERLGCEEWMPNYIRLPSGRAICVNGHMAAEAGETVMALALGDAGPEPYLGPLGGDIAVAVPLRPGTEPRPDPPLPKGWSLSAPAQAAGGPGIGVFAGSLEDPTLQQGLVLPLRWGEQGQ